MFRSCGVQDKMEVTSHMSCQMKLGCPAVFVLWEKLLKLTRWVSPRGEKHEEAALSNKKNV